MAVAHDIEALLAQFASVGKLRVARSDDVPSRALPLSWPELDAILPDGGLPRGVVELAAPRALGGSTSVALAAIRAGQARSSNPWCAWLDPEGTLHAPGVVAAGVDLSRMLVVRPPRAQLWRIALKTVASGAFEVVVVDSDPVPFALGMRTAGGFSGGAAALPPGESGPIASAERSPEGRYPSLLRRGGDEAAHKQNHKQVRKLVLAAEPSGTTVLLLTDASKPRVLPWPVALRIELSRPSPRELVVRVAKDKRGRVGLAKTIAFRLVPKIAV